MAHRLSLRPNWQHSDPLTGSSFNTDSARTFSNQKEIGTLGEDVTTPPPPNPPRPNHLNPTTNWLIEAQHDWSDPIYGSFLEEGMKQYVSWMNGVIAAARTTDAQKVEAQTAYDAYKKATDPTQKAKYKKIFDGILAGNPNVGIIVTEDGTTRTLWGQEAADFLDGTDSASVSVPGGDQQNSADKYIADKYKKQFNAALTEAEKRL